MGKVNLESFAGGALQEKFDDAMDKVLQNLMDPNTPWKNKREITIKVSFTQNEDRDDTAVDVSVATKLAAVKPIETRMAIGKDISTGEVFAEEYGSQVRGQMTLEDYQTQQRTESDSTERQDVKVVDFREKQA